YNIYLFPDCFGSKQGLARCFFPFHCEITQPFSIKGCKSILCEESETTENCSISGAFMVQLRCGDSGNPCARPQAERGLDVCYWYSRTSAAERPAGGAHTATAAAQHRSPPA